MSYWRSFSAEPQTPSSSSPSQEPKRNTPLCQHSLGSRMLRNLVKPRRSPLFVLTGTAQADASKVSSDPVFESTFYVGEHSFPELRPVNELNYQCPSTVIPAHSSSSNALQSNTMAPLSIETFGGETAGAGLDYISQLPDGETSCMQSRKSAQNLALSNMRNEIDQKKKEIQQLEIDEVMLKDYVATNFTDVDGLHEDGLKAEIADLERAIAQLPQHLQPPVAPPVPQRPKRSRGTPDMEEWMCVKCSSANNEAGTRCIKCGMPHLSVNKGERDICGCDFCCPTMADRFCVSPDNGSDWLLVDAQ